MTALVDGRRRGLWSAIVVLLVIVVVFVVLRLLVDVPLLLLGAPPSTLALDSGYAAHPVPAYLHIIPGTVYLLGAPWQLWRRFREQHFTLHRRLGRVLLGAALVSGVLAVVVGIWFPYGGPVETGASVVFGLWFLTALSLAFAAVGRGDITVHRRWMIRAFTVGLGIATVRIWLGIFQASGLLDLYRDTGRVWFGAAFWIAFALHVLVGEAYLSARPSADGPRSTTTA